MKLVVKFLKNVGEIKVKVVIIFYIISNKNYDELFVESRIEFLRNVGQYYKIVIEFITHDILIVLGRN